MGNRNAYSSVRASGNIIGENNLIAFNQSGYTQSNFSSCVLRNNLFYANAAGDTSAIDPSPIGLNGNIHADPRFAAAGIGNMHLLPGSPCIDVGDDGVVSTGDADSDGHARIRGAHVDIGAFEYDGTAWPTERRIVRVTPVGNDANDGSSWDKAMKTVRAAVESLPPAEVWVAAGAYPEGLNVGPWVSLYGGFAGTESVQADRDPSAHTTELTAAGAGPSVSSVSGVYPGTLDGFTVRNGGGISCATSVATIAHNRVTGSSKGISATDCELTLTENSISANTGSGVAISGGTSVVSGNTISDNMGSGLTFNSAGTVLNNRITGNTTTGWGGGIHVDYPGTTVFADNLIAHNSAVRGGGIWLSTTQPTPSLTLKTINNTIVDNSASDHGGGIYGYFDVTANNIIAFNTSGIFTTGVQGDARNNCVYGNTQYDYLYVTPYGAAAGNISIDPLFANRTASDYHLMPASPCVDAGDASAVAAEWLDLDGAARIQGHSVDMGAYETAAATGYTLADAVLALRIAGGLSSVDPSGFARLNAVTNDASSNGIDIADVIGIAQKVEGLTANP